MSCVTFHVACVIFVLFFDQICEASRWSVCYQRGLPRLVYKYLRIQKKNNIVFAWLGRTGDMVLVRSLIVMYWYVYIITLYCYVYITTLYCYVYITTLQTVDT